MSESRPTTATLCSAVPGTPLRILSYNVFLRPPGIHNPGTSDYKDRRVELLIDGILPNYDIICLQECFSFMSSRQQRIIDAAMSVHDFCGSEVSPGRSGWTLRTDGGLCILSRYPILESKVTTFDRGISSDWLAAKGVVYTRLEVPRPQDGAPHCVHVFTTHTQASYGTPPPTIREDKYVQMRLRQAYWLREFMDACLRGRQLADETVIVCGDLNANAIPRDTRPGSSEEYLALISILSGRGVDETAVAKLERRYRPDDNGRVFSRAAKFSVHDLLLQSANRDVDPAHAVHPPTYPSNGDGNLERLDFIFILVPAAETAADKHDAVLGNAHVEAYRVENEPFSNMSDHSAVAATVFLPN